MENLYTILADVRMELNEYSSDYMTGVDTSGQFLNAYLVSKINTAYRQLWAILAKRIPAEFTASATLTPTSSVLTLPSDFGAVIELRDSAGEKINPVAIQNQRRQGDNQYEYYRSGLTLVINSSSVSGAYTLIYLRKCRNLIMGAATVTTGPTVVTFPAGEPVADLYNGQTCYNITSGLAGTITDYSAEKVVTTSLVFANTNIYATVPEIPEPFHQFINTLALHLIKAGYVLSPVGVNGAEASLWSNGLGDVLDMYANDEDGAPLFEYGE